MKNSILIAGALAFLVACSDGTSGDKAAQLESLKKQQAEINDQIKKLEKEMGSDSSLASATNEKRKYVAITQLQPQLFKHYIEVQGRVDADQNVTLSAKMAGSVTRINVTEGQQVSTGQILAEVENDIIVKGIEELKTGLAFATEVFEKQEALWKQKVGSEIQYLQAKNNKESLEKKLAGLNEQLDLTRIKSPINGVVDEVMLKVGEIAAPGMPAVRVVNLSQLKVKANIPESYASLVKKGNTVELIFPDMKDTLETQVSYAARVIDPLTRTFNVEINLKGGNQFNPNMIALIKIVDYKNDNVIVAPINTIQRAADNDFVFIANGDQAKKVIVKTGRIYNGNIEVLSGLKAGDKLITAGYQDLNEGEAIKH